MTPSQVRCVRLRLHERGPVDDVFGSGHLTDEVYAMALAWIGAASKAMMSGRLSA